MVPRERFGLSHLKALALLFQRDDLGNEQEMSFQCPSAQHQVSVCSGPSEVQAEYVCVPLVMM